MVVYNREVTVCQAAELLMQGHIKNGFVVGAEVTDRLMGAPPPPLPHSDTLRLMLAAF